MSNVKGIKEGKKESKCMVGAASTQYIIHIAVRARGEEIVDPYEVWNELHKRFSTEDSPYIITRAKMIPKSLEA